MPPPGPKEIRKNFGWAWILFLLGCALHIYDLVAHEFIDYYNATVLGLYSHFAFFPRMDLTYPTWLAGLLLGELFLLALTPLAFRNARQLRPFAYFLSIVAVFEFAGQIALTLRGHTTPSVQFVGPSPGAYTAPLLLAVGAFLFFCLRKSRARG